ncbi:DUF6049 family protein [Streptomyces sp. SID3343]|uniref:DUF6049 family protein n=1 Tax=Streptomyces sp. SID3343 TaxID=2690260 RepID=UPI00136ED193|nr:hypothetical protein [Streptomyces sp. SID3343]
MVRGRALVVILLLTASLFALSPWLPAPPASAAEGSDVQVIVDDVSPAVARPAGQDVKLTGSVLNKSAKAIDQADVSVRLRDQPMIFRDSLSSQDENASTGQPQGTAVTVRNLAPGATAPWSITIKAKQPAFNPNKAGVYALAVEARSGTRSLGVTRTFLPWVPTLAKVKDDLSPLQVATVLPLVDRPHRDGTTIGDNSQTPVFRDDDLARSLAPGGRLYDLVNATEGFKADWAIDPELIDAARDMAGGYRVAPPGSLDPDVPKKKRDTKDAKPEDTAKATPNEIGNTLPGGGGATAAAWLDRLKTLLGAQPVIGLPYGDTDLALVAHGLAGSGKIDLRPELTEARRESAEVLQQTLPNSPVRTDVAWPADGALDEAIIALTQGMGTNTVLTSGRSLPPTRQLNHTPTAKATLPGTDGQGTALVTDPTIDALIRTDTRAPGQKALLTQRLTAELLTISLDNQRPNRGLVIAPPRTTDASLVDILKKVLKDSNDWTNSASLAEVAGAPATPTARKLAEYPHEVRASEPSGRFLTDTRNLSESTHTFAAILTIPERVTGPFDPAVLRLLSTQWRGDPQAAERYRLGVTRSLRELQSLVYVVRKTGVTLSGDAGNIPITVVNGLQQPINITIELTSHQPNRLKLGQPMVTTVPAGRTQMFKTSAESAANGKVLVDIKLLAPDGRQFKAPESFFVNTTTIDGLTRWIIGVLAFLLAVFSVRAFLRRRREAALAADGDGEDGEVRDDAPWTPDADDSTADPLKPSSTRSPEPPMPTRAGGNGPPDPADPRGHTPSGSTTDRPE